MYNDEQKTLTYAEFVKKMENGVLVVTRLIGLRQTCCGCVLNIQSLRKLTAIQFRGRLWTKNKGAFLGLFPTLPYCIFVYRL